MGIRPPFISIPFIYPFPKNHHFWVSARYIFTLWNLPQGKQTNCFCQVLLKSLLLYHFHRCFLVTLTFKKEAIVDFANQFYLKIVGTTTSAYHTDVWHCQMLDRNCWWLIRVPLIFIPFVYQFLHPKTSSRCFLLWRVLLQVPHRPSKTLFQ